MTSTREEIRAADDYDLLILRKSLAEDGADELEDRILWGYLTAELERRGLLAYDDVAERYAAV